MLSRTHGQPATPTTFGKELAVFVARWRRQLEQLDRQEYRGKLNGAVGTYGALQVADPDRDWERVSLDFVESLGLTWSPLTTQIEPHDWIAELFHALGRFNTILSTSTATSGRYISRGAGQAARGRRRGRLVDDAAQGQPDRLREQRGERRREQRAAGQHMASTLAVSRLQRDLADSSLLRNGGTVIGHSLLAIRSTLRGLGKIDVDAAAMEAELAGAWEVLAEAVQTVMRKRGGEDPYDQLKGLTRGAGISEERLREFVSGLDLDPEDRERLLALRPETYVGLAARLVDHLR